MAAGLLLLPLAAMAITDEMVWDAADFAILAVMLLAACGAHELVVRLTGSKAFRAAVGVAVVAAFILVWINLAVGIIGSEDHPANLIFAGVIAVALLGTLIARLRPWGMARALAATALAQVVAGAVALVAGWGSAGANWPGAIVVLTGFFASLWLLSGWLFLKAAREQAGSIG
ncbi:MAG TPA: hypothetical protein VIL09_12885 [Microvirga sp.]|jgi:hypothetical protein